MELNSSDYEQLKNLFLVKDYRDFKQLKVIDSSRDNYVLINDANSVIVRVSINKSYEDVSREVELIKYLEKKRFPVSKILDFNFIEVENKKYPVVCFQFVKHEKDYPINSKTAAAAAQTLGRLHDLTHEYCKSKQYDQNRSIYKSLEILHNNIYEKGSKAKNRDDILKDLEWGIDFYKSQNQNSNKLILHNDYRSNNVLFDSSNEVTAVIDFDWSLQSCFAIKDLSHSALEWAFPEAGKLNENIYYHFIKNYWQVNKSTERADMHTIWAWSQFSALVDAAHYFLSFPERTHEKFESYMYDKYLYFKTNKPNQT